MLMIIGSSPSGTGGGLKCTTFSAFLGVMRSAARGEHEVRFWGRPIPLERVWTAVGSVGFYLSALVIGTYLLELTESSPFDQNLFEAVSALGTVGLSMGITASLTDVGKVIIILLMFFGRLGPLTFGMALFSKPEVPCEKQDNDLAV
jgi:trk system potassium uptake protein TrkH